jgi:hypothetical protein
VTQGAGRKGVWGSPVKMACLKLTLELLSVTAAFGSGLLLYYGALGVPWEKQSYKGQTQFELETKHRQKLMVWIGVPCAFVAYFLQLAVILAF